MGAGNDRSGGDIRSDDVFVGPDAGDFVAVGHPVAVVPPAGRLAVWRLQLSNVMAGVGDLLAEEADLGRLFLWLPVFLALGAAGYFALPREPMLIALALATGVLLAIALRVRSRPVLHAALAAAVAFAAGMTLAKLRTEAVRAPILDRERTVTFAGTIERVEGAERGLRLTVRLSDIDDRVPAPNRPERIRISVRSDAPHLFPGAAIEGLARLRPPQGPVLPGGYDFARTNFFNGIGATGFSYGTPDARKRIGAEAETVADGFSTGIERIRDALSERIRETLTGDAGAVAVALIVGDRQGIAPDTADALRHAGLAHILAISGLHMALVGGVVFWMVRAFLALFPDLATRHPIRKWAAAAALLTGAGYLLVSGMGIATQRAFIMAVIVLIAVLVDRPALTMRSVALAALVVVALAPESVVGPSFQMSFAAVIALVAGYEILSGRQDRKPDGRSGEVPRGRAARVANKLSRYVVGLALTSLIAGLATAPVAAFHFHRIAPFGLIANLAAMPVVAMLIMPAGVLSMAAVPFGLDPLVLPVMGAGIDMVIAISRTVADWTPHGGVIGRVPLGTVSMLAVALVWFSLWRTRMRWFAVVPALLGLAVVPFAARPDILIAADGKVAALRGADGRLRVAAGRGTTFVVSNWLTADGDRRAADDPSLKRGLGCDAFGCVLASPLAPKGTQPERATDAGQADKAGRVRKVGRARLFAEPPFLVAVVRDPLAFREDCLLADIVVSSLAIPSTCRPRVLAIGREGLKKTGSLALYSIRAPPSDATANAAVKAKAAAVGEGERGAEVDDGSGSGETWHTAAPAFRVVAALPRFPRPWHPNAGASPRFLPAEARPKEGGVTVAQ